MKQLLNRLSLLFICGWIGLSACTSSNNVRKKGMTSLDSYGATSEILPQDQQLQSLLTQIQKDLDTLASQNKELRQQLEKQQLALNQLHQEMENNLSLSQQVTQHDLKLRQLSAQYSRTQRDIREMHLLVDLLKEKEPTYSRTSSLAPQTAKTKATPEANSLPTNRKKSDASELLEQGQEAYRAKQHLQAIEIFETIRNLFPGHPHAIEAHYWIGESYFAMGEFQRAAIAFYDFIDQNPRHSRTIHARWKLAQSLEKSGDIGLALNVYQDLVDTVSPYQKQAKERVDFYENKQLPR
ncbi:tetratricopeptide repeat protein [Deltaproteobacteria bacterium TL4]